MAETKKIIMLLGRGRYGKSTVAKLLRDRLTHVVEVALADPFKVFAQLVFEIPYETLWGLSEKRDELLPKFEYEQWSATMDRFTRHVEDWVNQVSLGDLTKSEGLHAILPAWLFSIEDKLYSGTMTCRDIMQGLGTECGRAIDENMWVDKAFNEAECFFRNPNTRAVVIPDGRCLNEVQGAAEFKSGDITGEVWRIVRDNAPEIEGEAGDHHTEHEYFSREVQSYASITIDNNGTLDDLEKEVARAVKQSFGRP